RAAAIAHFEEALAANAAMGARPQFAHTQVDLAQTLLAGGSAAEQARAREMLAEARATASELGMKPLRERIDDLQSPAASPGAAAEPAAAAAPSGAAPVARLRRDGEVWTVSHDGATFLLKDSKGLAALALLLRHPGREFHVLDLAGPGPADDGAASAA